MNHVQSTSFPSKHQIHLDLIDDIGLNLGLEHFITVTLPLATFNKFYFTLIFLRIAKLVDIWLLDKNIGSIGQTVGDSDLRFSMDHVHELA